MLCTICKIQERWAEYQISGEIRACPECKARFSGEILLVCQCCKYMTFIYKTPRNIERLQYFVNASITHFLCSDVIIMMNGCPHCVTFEHSLLGEKREFVKDHL